MRLKAKTGKQCCPGIPGKSVSRKRQWSAVSNTAGGKWHMKRELSFRFSTQRSSVALMSSVGMKAWWQYIPEETERDKFELATTNKCFQDYSYKEEHRNGVVGREAVGSKKKFLFVMGEIKACLLLEGSFPRPFFISACLVGRDTGCLCSGLSFQGYLYDEQLSKTKRVSPSRTKVGNVYRPV